MGKPVIGEVVGLPFPQTNLPAGKRRPALGVADLAGDNLIRCQITSQTRSDGYSVPLTLADFACGRLALDSFIPPNRLFTVEQSVILYAAGTVKDVKLKEVRVKIRGLFPCRRARPELHIPGRGQRSDRHRPLRPLRACLRTRQVRAPGLQATGFSAKSCRPRALTRRFPGVFKPALRHHCLRSEPRGRRGCQGVLEDLRQTELSCCPPPLSLVQHSPLYARTTTAGSRSRLPSVSRDSVRIK